ncbi:acyl-CoA dehydrogenase family protein [Nocardioides sp. Kera G14]|uniref:acyl-CoA dehydrogenase family protein n=1 Tax=Nocardioides sp. Kera G14 TaxID=2884264 RepID=UPI001D0FAC41|nr:acyl-CoA dehydrogenase [Nocardioides sp. Kera G14]UDY22275.1 acyl-CoA dehydrogenase family protein [Nocardioides sp. Kera G14]
MRFTLTSEQRAFREALDDLLGAADTPAAARAWADGDPQPGLGIWKQLADLGLNGLLVTEEDGGVGGSHVDLAVAHEALGFHGAVGPSLEVAFLACLLDGERAAALAEGTVATVAHDPVTPWALDADVASVVYATTVDGLHVANVGHQHASIDTTRRLFDVDAHDGPIVTAEDLDAALDVAALACAAQLLGAGERVLTDAVAYAKQRSQFGRPIGSFQALKHQLADVRIALDFARPLVFGAALAIDDDSRTASRSVSAAKAYANHASLLAARTALQVHGAVGYTRELDLSLWLLRIQALQSAWGTTAWHRERVLDSLCAGPTSAS